MDHQNQYMLEMKDKFWSTVNLNDCFPIHFNKFVTKIMKMDPNQTPDYDGLVDLMSV